MKVVFSRVQINVLYLPINLWAVSEEKKQRIREMREICIPEEISYHGINRLYRDMGFLFTRMFLRTKITPNQITWIWGALAFIFCLFFLFDDPWLHIAGAVGWMMTHALDHTDGHVARYKQMFSKAGAFLDGVIHLATWALLFICIGFGRYFVSGDISDVVFGVMAGLFMSLILALNYLYQTVAGERPADAGIGKTSERKFRLVINLSPLSTMNVYPVILAVTIFDMIFSVQLLWMTSLLSVALLCYGIGFALMFLWTAGRFCRNVSAIR